MYHKSTGPSFMIGGKISRRYFQEERESMTRFEKFLINHKTLILGVMILPVLLVTAVCIYLAARPVVEVWEGFNMEPSHLQEDVSNGGDGDPFSQEESSLASSSKPEDAETTDSSSKYPDDNSLSSGFGAGGLWDSSNQNSQDGWEGTENSSDLEEGCQHTWVDHTATVWVENWVTVVDEPEKTVDGVQFYTLSETGEYIANGPVYWFENGFTQADLQAIIVEGIKNEDENGLFQGVYYHNYQNVTKTVPAVTHEEDQGYYEEVVEYQYCSQCGQRK